ETSPGVASSPVRVSVDPGRSADFGSARRNSTGLYGGEPFHILTVFLGTGCMIKLQSSMSKHIPQFCGVLGRTFMEFLKGSGDYCQAQHAAYADE
ncbi:hypothetical protein AMECASPLE_018752, partial [Ameca splendens]